MRSFFAALILVSLCPYAWAQPKNLAKVAKTFTRTVHAHNGRLSSASYGELLARTKEFIHLQGRRPKSAFWRNGKEIKPYHLTEAQQNEIRLSREIHYAFVKARENHLELSNLPQLQELYDLVHAYPNPTRQPKQLDKTAILELVKAFVEKHGVLPRSTIQKNGISQHLKMLSDQERAEVMLGRDFRSIIHQEPQSEQAQELIALEQTIQQAKLAEKVSKESSKIKQTPQEKAAVLLDQLKQFIETYDRSPRITINKNKYPAAIDELNAEEQREVRLARQIFFLSSRLDPFDPAILQIKQLLARYTQKGPKDVNEAFLEEVRNWIELHGNRFPRSTIHKRGTYQGQNDLTFREKEEIALRKKIERFLRTAPESELLQELRELKESVNKKYHE